MRNRSCLVALSALALVVAWAPSAGALTYEILIENLVPGGMATGQPLAPPLAVVHDGTYTLFEAGGKATPGLELQAEDGDPSVLASEAMAAAGVSAVVVGGGPFFDMMMLSIEGEPGDLLSISSMLGRTNDLITGIHDVPLPAAGEMVIMTDAYDAGTEVNTGMAAHIPFYGNVGVGPSEAVPIAMITSYTIVDDPDEGMIEFEFPPVARITITALDPSPVEETTWGRVKDLYDE